MANSRHQPKDYCRSSTHIFIPIFILIIILVFLKSAGASLNLRHQNSLNIPKNFLNEIESKRLVFLGEQSHGEGNVFSYKVELIKYLHQNHDFNVIAFESGIFDCYYADKQGEYEILKDAILPIWSNSNELQPLFKYIIDSYKTENPIRLVI
jgi:erythromycin esterase-like protein